LCPSWKYLIRYRAGNKIPAKNLIFQALAPSVMREDECDTAHADCSDARKDRRWDRRFLASTTSIFRARKFWPCQQLKGWVRFAKTQSEIVFNTDYNL